MSDKEKTNKKSILTGAISGILLPLFSWEIIQGVIALFFGASNLSFKLSGIKLYASFNWEKEVVAGAFLFLIPYLLSLSAITAAFLSFKKTLAGFYRNSLIVFTLILSGFLIFDVFYGAFSIILKFNPENDWAQLTSLLGFSEAGSIIFIFLIIIFTAGYLNLALKKTLNFINT